MLNFKKPQQSSRIALRCGEPNQAVKSQHLEQKPELNQLQDGVCLSWYVRHDWLLTLRPQIEFAINSAAKHLAPRLLRPTPGGIDMNSIFCVLLPGEKVVVTSFC